MLTIILQSYLMHNCTADFISDIGRHADSDTAFNAIASTKKFALDIIASCAYGIEVHRVQNMYFELNLQFSNNFNIQANSFKVEGSEFSEAVRDIMRIKMFGWQTVWNVMYLFPPLR